MIYNHKSNDIVQDVVLESYCPLLEDIEEEFSTLRRYGNLSIYAPADITKEIIAHILDIEKTWIHINSNGNLLYDNNNEILITIGYDGMIFIESARNENGQLKNNEDCSLTYVYDGFSKKDIDILSSSGESILIFGFEEDEIENVGVTTTEETKSITYPSAKNNYFVNGKKVTKEVFDEYDNFFDKRMKEFENKIDVLKKTLFCL